MYPLLFEYHTYAVNPVTVDLRCVLVKTSLSRLSQMLWRKVVIRWFGELYDTHCELTSTFQVQALALRHMKNKCVRQSHGLARNSEVKISYSHGYSVQNIRAALQWIWCTKDIGSFFSSFFLLQKCFLHSFIS